MSLFKNPEIKRLTYALMICFLLLMAVAAVFGISEKTRRQNALYPKLPTF